MKSMDRNKLISCFQDTMNMAYSASLLDATELACKSSRVYREGFVSPLKRTGADADVIVEENTTFAAARKYLMYGKTAVLNFANLEVPGGGVKNGAMAQEECLCRSSNLYACLQESKVFPDFYEYHRNLHNIFYSDRLIYTSGVTVFKTDDDIPQIMEESEWFNVDVITCSAPYLAMQKYIDLTVLKNVFKSRVKNIFEAAKDNGIDVIILGAFGCGAFKNNPRIVAEAFAEVIREEDYKHCFKNIVFAIKRTGEVCENLNAFSEQFAMYEQDANEKIHILDSHNPYFGKKFSILGDSISTLEGYNPQGYNVFYTGEKCQESNVYEMKDTWWGKVIKFFGGELLVNNSWSGSRVTRLPNREGLFPSGCSDERTSGLHIGTVKPDIIIVNLGSNDWAYGVRLALETSILGVDEMEYFGSAYYEMLRKLKANYPDTEIWCCTLNSTYISSNPNFTFPEIYNGNNIRYYNDEIRESAESHGCRLIDLYNPKIPCDTIDGSHPTKDGMNTLATMITRAMCDKKGIYLPDFSNSETKSEYIRLQADATMELYSDEIRLYDLNNKEDVSLPKADVFSVGREKKNVLLRLNNSAVSRVHATFYYEKGTWYLADNDSTNGTWINETKLIPNKKYELTANDIISFAATEKFVFFKRDRFSETAIEENPIFKDLENCIEVFAKSNYTDASAFKLIIWFLSLTPLYFPVDFDMTTMLGNINPQNLKAGDIIQPQQNVKMRILTLLLDSGEEIIPMFTTKEEAAKGKPVSVIRYFPQDYANILVQMGKTAVVNPFNELRFVLTQEIIKNILIPLIEKQENINNINTQNDENVVDLTGTEVNNRYRLLKHIGRGGISEVYVAEDIKLNKMWAVKVCDKYSDRYHDYIYNVFVQEINMMRNLNHPAIPKIFDVIEDSRYLFVVMDYVEGNTLQKIIEMHGAQPQYIVVEWVKQVCNILNYLHTLNPPHIYRDVKPANLMLTPNGYIRIIDFGIARTYKPNKSCDTVVLGTKGYAAPEQFGSGQTDARTDIYGLGMTMHQLLTGLDPKFPTYEQMPIRQINPMLSKGLEYIVSKCIEPDPAKRYQNCTELLADLNQYQNLPPKGFLGKLFKK